MSTILVTGGAGAIGSQLVRTLSRDHDVLVLDDLSSGFYQNIKDLAIRFWRGSVGDDELLKEVMAARPSVVFHLAANFANQNSVDYPQKDLLVNGLGTLKLLQYAADAGVERFIYTSSSCVYGMLDQPIPESTHSFSLDTPYAITKLLGEQYVNFFHGHYGIPTVILRLFNSYGPGEYPGKYRNVIPNFFYRALTGKALVITGDGHETRDFTFIGDVVAALRTAMSHAEAVGQTFNVGTGREVSILELSRMILHACGTDVPLEFRPRRDWDSVSRRRADIGLIRRVLDFSPTVDLQEGLALTHRWFVENRVAELHFL